MPSIQKYKENGPLTSRNSNFFEVKTIQRAYNFIVYFDVSGDSNLNDLPSFLCTGVEIPEYSFKKEYVHYGPFMKSFPVLDHNGFEFTMKLEEDEHGTVKGLIQSLVRKQMTQSGYYNNYSSTTIPQIVASVYTCDAWNAYKVHFLNCFYMKSSTANYAWNSSEKIEYDITFNCDHYYVQVQEQVPPSKVDEVIKTNKVKSKLNNQREGHTKE